jgi:N6-L-threonylcarbamoyladenine synthase
MKILSIETSCDETAIAIIDTNSDLNNPEIKVLGNTLISQIDVHKEYGGVFPTLARREHAKNLVPLLIKTLQEANLYSEKIVINREETGTKLKEILSKEPDLYNLFIDLILSIEIPNIDLIAVTEGPGLAPALWVGLNFAEALRFIWNKPVIGINHMEGHIWSVLYKSNKKLVFPALSLLVSGGHTELIYIENYNKFEIIGKTKDDAVGEAFDKVARVLGLPYPGGPEISRLASKFREEKRQTNIVFPQPMIHSQNLDFSFSGLKTSVLYKVKSLGELNETLKEEIAYAFEEAAVSVLLSKVKKALDTYPAKTLIIGGGVISNQRLQERLNVLQEEYSDLILMLPAQNLATDNAIMIGIAAWIQAIYYPILLDLNTAPLKAQANLSL